MDEARPETRRLSSEEWQDAIATLRAGKAADPAGYERARCDIAAGCRAAARGLQAKWRAAFSDEFDDVVETALWGKAPLERGNPDADVSQRSMGFVRYIETADEEIEAPAALFYSWVLNRLKSVYRDATTHRRKLLERQQDMQGADCSPEWSHPRDDGDRADPVLVPRTLRNTLVETHRFALIALRILQGGRLPKDAPLRALDPAKIRAIADRDGQTVGYLDRDIGRRAARLRWPYNSDAPQQGDIPTHDAKCRAWQADVHQTLGHDDYHGPDEIPSSVRGADKKRPKWDRYEMHRKRFRAGVGESIDLARAVVELGAKLPADSVEVDGRRLLPVEWDPRDRARLSPEPLEGPFAPGCKRTGQPMGGDEDRGRAS